VQDAAEDVARLDDAWDEGLRRWHGLQGGDEAGLCVWIYSADLHSAYLPGIGRDVLTSFYLEAHNTIRSITGFGEGHGPFMSVHDGFQGTASWAGFLPGSDRIILDTHPYFAFDGAKNDAPVATGTEIVGSQPEAGDGVVAGGIWPKQACSAWGPALNTRCVSFISVSLLPFGLRHGVAK
jgi:hypothetical protein